MLQGRPDLCVCVCLETVHDSKLCFCTLREPFRKETPFILFSNQQWTAEKCFSKLILWRYSMEASAKRMNVSLMCVILSAFGRWRWVCGFLWFLFSDRRVCNYPVYEHDTPDTQDNTQHTHTLCFSSAQTIHFTCIDNSCAALWYSFTKQVFGCLLRWI